MAVQKMIFHLWTKRTTSSRRMSRPEAGALGWDMVEREDVFKGSVKMWVKELASPAVHWCRESTKDGRVQAGGAVGHGQRAAGLDRPSVIRERFLHGPPEHFEAAQPVVPGGGPSKVHVFASAVGQMQQRLPHDGEISSHLMV